MAPPGPCYKSAVNGTLGLTHIQITVSDVPRSMEFYGAVFGMEQIHLGEPDPKFVFLRTPGAHDTFTLNGYIDGGVRPGDMGAIQHFGFAVPDPAEWERLLGSVERHGGKLVRRGERDGGMYAFVTDPDGYKIEIYTD